MRGAWAHKTTKLSQSLWENVSVRELWRENQMPRAHLISGLSKVNTQQIIETCAVLPAILPSCSLKNYQLSHSWILTAKIYCQSTFHPIRMSMCTCIAGTKTHNQDSSYTYSYSHQATNRHIDFDMDSQILGVNSWQPATQIFIWSWFRQAITISYY